MTSVIPTDVDSHEADKVRYAWADAPSVDLYNWDGLPAVPFERPVEP